MWIDLRRNGWSIFEGVRDSTLPKLCYEVDDDDDDETLQSQSLYLVGQLQYYVYETSGFFLQTLFIIMLQTFSLNYTQNSFRVLL